MTQVLVHSVARKLGSLVAALVVAASVLIGVVVTPFVGGAAPAGASGCVVPVKGAWSGFWASSVQSGPGYQGLDFGHLTFPSAGTAGNFKVSGRVTVLGSAVTIGGKVTGAVTCGSVQFGLVSGPVSVNFSGTINPGGTSGSGTYSEFDGALSDNGTFNVALVAVSVAPTSGPAGTPVTITSTGGPYKPGEMVTASYATRLSAPKTVTLCSGFADVMNGSFSCSGSIPSAPGAGPLGKHTITVTGGSSKITAKTAFGLTP